MRSLSLTGMKTVVRLATPAASQQHKKIFFLAASTLLQVPVPVLKIQVPIQIPVLRMQVQDKYQYQYPKNVLKYNLSTSTSTKYNKTANCSKLIRNQIKWNSI